jgi:hypothetical protein
MALCPLAIHVLHPGRSTQDDIKGPCPLLETGPDNKAACGLVVYPATYFPILAKRVGNSTLSRAASFLIGSGVGCDAIGEDETENLVYTVGLYDKAHLVLDQMTAAWRIWGRRF